MIVSSEDIIDRKIIGLCGKFKTAITKLVQHNIGPEYFISTHQSIIAEILSYYKTYFQLITGDALSQILIDKGQDEQTVTAIVTTFEDIINDTDIVKDQSSLTELDYFIDKIKKRKALSICEDASKKLATAVVSGKINAARDLMMKAIVNVDKANNTGEIQEGSLEDFVDKRIERYQDRKNNPDKYRGIQSGFPVLDETTDGFQPGDLVIYVAESGAGKSANMLHTGYEAWLEKYKGAKEGANVALFTIEMDWYQYLRRFDARDSMLDSYKLKSASLSDYEYQAWIGKLDAQKKKKNLFYIVDIPSGCSTIYIRNKLDEINLKYPDHPIDLIIVDYLNIMSPSQNVEGGDWLKQGIISQECKELARQVKATFLTAVQETRESAKDTKTQVKNTTILSRSQMIVTNANVIVYLKPHQMEENDPEFEIFKTYNDSPNVIHYQTLKSRDGKKVSWKCGADFSRMFIQPMQEKKKDDIDNMVANDKSGSKLSHEEDEEEFGEYYNTKSNTHKHNAS